MNDIAENFLKIARRRAADQQEQTEFFAQHVPDLPVSPASIDISTLGDPWLTYPYDRQLIQRLFEFLTGAGWILSYEKKESDLRGELETPRQTWRKKIEGRSKYPWDAEIILEFNDRTEGATCKRQQIGQHTDVHPVFEFTCNQEL